MKIKEITSPNSSFEYLFFCEGCEMYHGFRTINLPEPIGSTDHNKHLFRNKWNFNGDFMKPTVTPSILIHEMDENSNIKTKCHSIINDGKIEYLTDCNHKYAGKTIELPDIE